MAAVRFVRHGGVVLGLTVNQVLVGIVGVTDEDGVWIDREHLPASLHVMEANFDVWLRDSDPPEAGAYRPKPGPNDGKA